MVLLLAKQIITLYHAIQKPTTKDQHALGVLADLYLLSKGVKDGTTLLLPIIAIGGLFANFRFQRISKWYTSVNYDWKDNS